MGICASFGNGAMRLIDLRKGNFDRVAAFNTIGRFITAVVIRPNPEGFSVRSIDEI